MTEIALDAQAAEISYDSPVSPRISERLATAFDGMMRGTQYGLTLRSR